MKCEDKKAYDYYLDAGVVVNYLKNNNKRRWIYLCECGKFHLSSTLYKSKKKKLDRRVYKELGIYQGICIKKNEQCNGDVISREKDGPRLCEYHYKNGLLAQLGERFNGIEEVSGSIPLGSTNREENEV